MALNTKTSRGLVLAADFRILSPLHLHRLKAISNRHAPGIPGVDSVGLRRNGLQETGRILSKGEKAGAAIMRFPFCIDRVMHISKQARCCNVEEWDLVRETLRHRP
jgi:hypothetical protein